MNTKKINPWDRRPKESDAAYAAFVAYRDLGPTRSLVLANQSHPEVVPKSAAAKVLSAKHAWVARATAWDDHLQRERDRVTISELRKWASRRQAALEVNWEMAQSLRDKATKMLEWPISRTRTEGDRTIIEPARWTFITLAQVCRTVIEIETAVLQAAEPAFHTASDDLFRHALDLNAAGDSQLEQILRPFPAEEEDGGPAEGEDAWVEGPGPESAG